MQQTLGLDNQKVSLVTHPCFNAKVIIEVMFLAFLASNFTEAYSLYTYPSLWLGPKKRFCVSVGSLT